MWLQVSLPLVAVLLVIVAGTLACGLWRWHRGTQALRRAAAGRTLAENARDV